MQEDEDFVPVSLAIVAHTDLVRAQQILKYISEVASDRIIYKRVAPRGVKLWIAEGGEDLQEAIERAEAGEAP